MRVFILAFLSLAAANPCFANASLIASVGTGQAVLYFQISEMADCRLFPPQVSINLSMNAYNITQALNTSLSGVSNVTVTFSCPSGASFAACTASMSGLAAAQFTIFSTAPTMVFSVSGFIPSITVRTFDYGRCWQSMNLALNFTNIGEPGFTLIMNPDTCSLANVANITLTLVYGAGLSETLVLNTTTELKPYNHLLFTQYNYSCKSSAVPNCSAVLLAFQSYSFRAATFTFMGNITKGPILVQERLVYDITNITGIRYNDCYSSTSLWVFRDHLVFYVFPPETTVPPTPMCQLPPQAATVMVFMTIYNVNNESRATVFYNQTHTPFFSFNTSTISRFFFYCEKGTSCTSQLDEVTGYAGNMTAVYGFNFYDKFGKFVDTMMYTTDTVHKSCFAKGAVKVYSGTGTICLETTPASRGNVLCSLPAEVSTWNVTVTFYYNYGPSMNQLNRRLIGSFTTLVNYSLGESFCMTCENSFVSGSGAYFNYRCPDLLSNLHRLVDTDNVFSVITYYDPQTNVIKERYTVLYFYFLDYSVMWIIFACILVVCAICSAIYTALKIRNYSRGVLK